MKIIILKILRKLKLLQWLNLTQKIIINKHVIMIPITKSIGFSNMMISEKWMIKVLEDLELKKEEIFIDVGVNIGQTLIKFKTVYPSMAYIGFEPNSTCVEYTKNLIAKNKWKYIDIVPVGIAEYSGLGILEHYVNDSVDSSASIIKNYRKDKVYIRDIVALLNVESCTHLWYNKTISMIKIDVEGAELGVLKSFFEIIKRDRPYILIEILPVYDKMNTERLTYQLEIEKILYLLEYTLYRIVKTSQNNLHSYQRINSIGIHDNIDKCDYLCKPKNDK